jgi:hypothetical protein
MFSLMQPLGAVGHLIIYQLGHGCEAALTVHYVVAPRIDDAGDCAIGRDILGVVPLVPFGIRTVRHGHATDLERRRHPAIGIFQQAWKDLLADDSRQVFAGHSR